MGDLIVFLDGAIPSNALKPAYNPGLIALSYVVASIAAYTALDFAGRMVESRGGYVGQFPVLNFQYRIITKRSALLCPLMI